MIATSVATVTESLSWDAFLRIAPITLEAYAELALIDPCWSFANGI